MTNSWIFSLKICMLVVGHLTAFCFLFLPLLDISVLVSKLAFCRKDINTIANMGTELPCISLVNQDIIQIIQTVIIGGLFNIIFLFCWNKYKVFLNSHTKYMDCLDFVSWHSLRNIGTDHILGLVKWDFAIVLVKVNSLARHLPWDFIWIVRFSVCLLVCLTNQWKSWLASSFRYSKVGVLSLICETETKHFLPSSHWDLSLTYPVPAPKGNYASKHGSSYIHLKTWGCFKVIRNV